MKLEVIVKLDPENGLPQPVPAVYKIELPGNPTDSGDVAKLVNSIVGMVNFDDIVPKLAESCLVPEQREENEETTETENDTNTVLH